MSAQPAAPASGRGNGEGGDRRTVPAMQSLLDNPFLLLFIGVAVPAVLYIIWGVMEVAHIPIGG